MIGIIDVGGGERGIYGAGVLDYCLKYDIRFDYHIGVSAGAANLSSYLAGQSSRNFTFYTDYSFRKEYMSLHQYLKTGNYINLDYIYSTLSNSDGENPLNFPAIQASGKIFKIVATDAETGEPIYFGMEDLAQDQYDAIKASSCVPGVNKPYPIGDKLCYDGGMSDPVPVKKALEDGCDKVVVILTRPVNQLRDPKKDQFIVSGLKKKYPLAADALARRADTYNREVELCKKLQEKGKVLIIAPNDISGLKPLTRDLEALKKLYHKAQDDATALIGFLGIEPGSLPPDEANFFYN